MSCYKMSSKKLTLASLERSMVLTDMGASYTPSPLSQSSLRIGFTSIRSFQLTRYRFLPSDLAMRRLRHPLRGRGGFGCKGWCLFRVSMA